MAEFGEKTVRSAHPLNIFRKPTVRPLWVIEGASTNGGRRILAHHALTPDGAWEGGTEDRGSMKNEEEPFFYMHFLGGEMSMNSSDMHEMIAGMKDRRAELKRKDPKPLPDLKKMREQLREAQKYLDEKRRGVNHFTV